MVGAVVIGLVPGVLAGAIPFPTAPIRGLYAIS